MRSSSNSICGVLQTLRTSIITHAPKEKIMFMFYWKHIGLGAFFNYVHSVAHNLAYMLHIPKEPLADLGFSLLPAMSTEVQIISEIAFFFIFILSILFLFFPFYHDNNIPYSNASSVANDSSTDLPALLTSSASLPADLPPSSPASPDNEDQKDAVVPLTSLPPLYPIPWPSAARTPQPVYTVQALARFLGVLLIAQSLRVTSFLLTSLPGPNYHCRPFSPHYNPPTELGELFFRQDAFFSCGDLVFSSHTTFILLCALTYTKYGRTTWLKKVFWAIVLFFGLLVAAARKHYTIDIVMAIYTVPLIWIVYDAYCPDVFPASLLALECQQQQQQYHTLSQSDGNGERRREYGYAGGRGNKGSVMTATADSDIEMSDFV